MELTEEQVGGELLTPEAFQAELIVIFERYRTGRKPESLQKKAELPPMESAKVVVEKFKQEPGQVASTLWGRFATTVKNTASDLSEVMATHNSLTKFVEEQMAQIMAKRASPLKKMTDLAILFHGLFLFISQGTHSKSLFALLTEFNEKLWAGTPLDERGEKKDLKVFTQRFDQQIRNAAFLCRNGGWSSEAEKWEQMFECVEPGELGVNLKSHQASIVIIWPEAWMGDTYATFLAKEANSYVSVGDNSNNDQGPRINLSVKPLKLPIQPAQSSQQTIPSAAVGQFRMFPSAQAEAVPLSRSLERFEGLDPGIEGVFEQLKSAHDKALRDAEQSLEENRRLREAFAQAKKILLSLTDAESMAQLMPAARLSLANLNKLLQDALDQREWNNLDL